MELLVVITIIGILIALLLPAVQAAREAARQLQCKNNLKQFALGCLTHEQAHGFLPGGGWHWYWQGDPDRGFGIRQPGGWVYNVLPFIEQAGMHDAGAGLALPQKQAAMRAVAQTPLSGLYCPSRRPAVTYPNSWSPCNIGGSVSLCARSDYACCAGSYFSYNTAFWYTGNPAGNPLPMSGDYSFADAPGYTWPTVFAWNPPTQAGNNGVIYTLSTTRMAEITDGASNTYVLGEKYLCPDLYDTGTSQSDNNTLYGGFDWDYGRWSNVGPLQDTPGYYNDTAFGSVHANGFHMAFCDGSVQMMYYTIDPVVHGYLGNRLDGQMIDGKKY